MEAAGGRLRLFFAVPLAAALRERALQLQQAIAERCGHGGPRIKWVERANLHLTLRFLGERPAGAVAPLAEVAAAVARERTSIALQVGGVGCFGSRGAPRTIWLGVTAGAEALGELAAALDVALEVAGLEARETRPFRAHLTLGRVKESRAAGSLPVAIDEVAAAPVGPMTVEALDLWGSELTPGGPIYTRLHRFPLGGRSGGRPAANRSG